MCAVPAHMHWLYSRTLNFTESWRSRSVKSPRWCCHVYCLRACDPRVCEMLCNGSKKHIGVDRQCDRKLKGVLISRAACESYVSGRSRTKLCRQY